MKYIYYLKKVFTKPPRVVINRVIYEIKLQVDRYQAPRRESSLTEGNLCAIFEMSNIDALWQKLLGNDYPVFISPSKDEYSEFIKQEDRRRILNAAKEAMRFEVDILGSGVTSLGSNIQWNMDYKTGFTWPNRYMGSIEYSNPGQPSDVKMAWELSRLQWLIPVGQAYLLTGDERYADFARSVLTHWIANNPYAYSVNWSCTMEPAMRIFTCTWFFHVFKNARSWENQEFRYLFLKALYLHGDFVFRHIEMSDVNGNHCTADAAALVFAGLFFQDSDDANLWHCHGWDVLCSELPRQVGNDGVDFEGSVPYHRLVTELFFIPALYREKLGLEVSEKYKDRVIKMAYFVKAYMRTNDTSPLLGDADDARVLPFGSQRIGNHHYLYEWIGINWAPDLLTEKIKGVSELQWLSHQSNYQQFDESADLGSGKFGSQAFEESGYYVMRGEDNHVFIDCAPVGLAGRGGHGHNDCLSFELCLRGVNLVTDSGAFVYTASYQERDLFRSTAYHNTPMVDGREINRFLGPEFIWNLHYDAVPDVMRWDTGKQKDVFVGSHAGFQGFENQVIPTRKIELIHGENCCIITDIVEGDGFHQIHIPFHLDLGVSVSSVSDSLIRLKKEGKEFSMSWSDNSDADWEVSVDEGRCSVSYGVVEERPIIRFRKEGMLPMKLSVVYS